jgi:hypothetical protein
MNTIVKQRITCAVFVSALMLFMGMMCVLSPAGAAYAADGTSGQGLAAAQGGVAAQDALVVNPSIPAPTNTASQYEVYPTYFFFNAGLVCSFRRHHVAFSAVLFTGGEGGRFSLAESKKDEYSQKTGDNFKRIHYDRVVAWSTTIIRRKACAVQSFLGV